jgi:hypothetical protein
MMIEKTEMWITGEKTINGNSIAASGFFEDVTKVKE